MGTDGARGYLVDPEWGEERRRLEVLAASCDPLTIERLDRVGIRPGWQCLEVGAGNGSVAAWMAGRVGSGGVVVATDIDVRFLDDLDGGPVTVLRHDANLEEFPPDSFDLIHARLVFMHLPDPAAVVTRAAKWLRPGGWLVIEEIDGAVGQASADPLWRAWWGAVAQTGKFSLEWARSMPGAFRAAGLVDVDAHGHLPLVRGSTPEATWVRLSVELMSPVLDAMGLWPAERSEVLMRRLDDPDLAEFHGLWIACWGRRP